LSNAVYGDLITDTHTLILDENFTVSYTGFRCDSTNRDQIEFKGVVENIDLSNWGKGNGFYFALAFGSKDLYKADGAVCEYHSNGLGVEVE